MAKINIRVRSIKGNNRATRENIYNNNPICNEIERRGIKWLCHFTPKSNLENIERYGLLLRDETPSNSVFTDDTRADREKNAICLSISKPNKKMFLRKQKIDGYDLALLLISPDVLFMRKCLFFPYNAAAASSKFLTSEQRMGIEAFNSLFAERIRYQKSGEEWIIVNRENHLDTAETTSDQAEVQCLEQISPQHIMRKISFNIPLSYQDVQDMAEKLYLNPREYRNFYEYELNYPKPDDTESLEDMPF